MLVVVLISLVKISAFIVTCLIETVPLQLQVPVLLADCKAFIVYFPS